MFSCQSVSDDSVDLGGSDKLTRTQSSQKPAQKPTVSRWQNDERSDGGSEKGNEEGSYLSSVCSHFSLGSFIGHSYSKYILKVPLT